MVKVPEASNRSSRVTKVINDAVNIGAPYLFILRNIGKIR